MRRRLGWAGRGAWVTGAVLVLLTGACSAGTPRPASDPTGPGADVGTRIDAALPARILDLPFTTSDGRAVSLRSFAGKLVAVSDVVTLCQETCPMDTATFVETARAEAAHSRSDEVFLSITVDPARDTTAQLAAYRQLFSPPPRDWLLLTGTPQSVDALWDYLGVYRHRVAEPPGPAPRSWRTNQPLTYDVQHSDEVFLLDRRTHERFVLEGPPYAGPASVPSRLKGFLNDEGRTNLAHPPSSDWTETQARGVLTWLRG